MLVRAAIAKYVSRKVVPDVSRALETLLEIDIRPKLAAHPERLAPSNSFRESIYVEEVDAVLRRHEAALRLIYAELCALKPTTMEDGGLANSLISYPSYMQSLRLFNLINADLTERDGTLAFVWCRMHTINEHAPKPRIRMTHLNFVDWLEAPLDLVQLVESVTVLS